MIEFANLALTAKPMTIEQLRAVHQAKPFQPFVIRLADGRSIPVPHAEFLSHSPSGRTAIVYHNDDSFTIVDLLLVTAIDVEPLLPAGGPPK